MVYKLMTDDLLFASNESATLLEAGRWTRGNIQRPVTKELTRKKTIL